MQDSMTERSRMAYGLIIPICCCQSSKQSIPTMYPFSRCNKDSNSEKRHETVYKHPFLFLLFLFLPLLLLLLLLLLFFLLGSVGVGMQRNNIWNA
uniref:Uncharacterized protein n=1 Tax=Arundo donax TaxID=35708 RepID=A0A0A9DYH7_ARUDO